ncbi:MAG: ABC transporter permease [Planctomycetota bacterium]
MKGLITLYRRELASLFYAPMGWLLLVLALLGNGLVFWAFLAGAQGNVSLALASAMGRGWFFWLFLVFLPPLLCMRLLAEESRTGTLEYLLTAPISDGAVVLAKFLAATTFMVLLWLSVPVYGLILQANGVAPDWGAMTSGFLGTVLLSGLFVSLSMFASSLFQAPLLAAFFGILGSAVWLILPGLLDLVMAQLRNLLAAQIGDWSRAEAWLGNAIESMDVLKHFGQSFLPGVFDSAELVFFLTWTGFFLFLAIRSLESRRWRA